MYGFKIFPPTLLHGLAKRMQDRLDWLNKYDEEHPTQPIQEEAKKTLEGIIKELN